MDKHEWMFPPGLTETQRAGLKRRLATLPADVAQVLLDELAGRMLVATVRNPVGYCATLIRRSREGSFVPELAPSIANARAQHQTGNRQLGEQGAANLPPGPLRDALDRVLRRTRNHPNRGRRGDKPD